MNKYVKKIGLFAILVLLLQACSDKILDKTPLDKFSDATVWTDVNLAKSYLNYCYNAAQVGQYKAVMIGAVSDEMFTSRGSSSSPYNVGAMNADNTSGAYGSNWFPNSNWQQFSNIQKINQFLEQIDKVPDAYSASQKVGIKVQTDILKGEALFLKAFLYTELCRTYGGLPILKKSNKLGDDFSGIKRATFKETVDFIIENCDAAAALLPLKSASELGRATKEAALSIKSRMLLFAASDLTADGTAANELVGYNNPNRTTLWTAARNAAKAVIDLGTCKLANFGAPDQKAVAQNYFNFFKAYDLSDKEVIWGIQYVLDLGTRHATNQTNGPNGNNCFGRNGPFEEMVNEYEMEDGSKYSAHYTIDANKYIKNISTKFRHESPYYNREARFYASVLFDSVAFQPRLANLASRDPLGIYERRLHKTVAANGTVFDDYGMDTRGATIFPAGGGYGGYLTKKFMDPAVKGINEYNQNIAIEIRYAEILLNYAEACLALGDIPTASTYINIIRNRSALPNFVGDITLALRHERKIELYAEGFRWYDIRRWKIMPQVFVPCGTGVDIIEKFTVATGVRTTTWQLINAQVANKWVPNMYWIPIQTDELKKAPQIIQNPGY
jgi:hypothetical protein